LAATGRPMLSVRKGIKSFHPEIGWENCTRCRKCEEVCPTVALKLDRPEEIREEKLTAIILALEYDDPIEEDLRRFGLGTSPSVIRNSEVARRSLITKFVKDSVRLPSGKMPGSFAVVVTPHFNDSGTEYESYNLCVSAAYRGKKLKQILPESEVTVYLKDYRGLGKMMSEISSIRGVRANESGFCRVRENSCAETDVDGIFAVGEFSGPKGNPEAIRKGCAVFTEALKYLGDSNFKPALPSPLRKIEGEELKIGVFICSCFGTFQEKMDLAALKEAVEALPDVAHTEIRKRCCTPPTIQETAELIKKSGVNRAVLAACTPIQKLLKFRNAAMKAGLNPLLSEFVRLREEAINVHSDKVKMLDKAILLVQSAVAKVRKGISAPMLADQFIPQALVIGGGLSGLTSALGIAENGFAVTLIEKKDKLGGNIKYLDPRQRQYLTELISKVENDPEIKVCRKSELKAMSGYAGNFHGRVLSEGKEVTVEAGVIILATGAKENRPKGFLYGEDPRVETQTELQDRLTGERTGIRVAMIQCVGSMMFGPDQTMNISRSFD
jgi:heterodisulfide reductase subunit A-like polyferredoxin